MKLRVLLATVVGTLAFAASANAHPQPGGFGFGLSAGWMDPDNLKALQMGMGGPPPGSNAPRSFAPCVRGMAREFPCDNVDLMSHVPIPALGGTTDGNDMWGWIDPETGRQYALAGHKDGTSFVDITDPKRPRVVGMMPTESTVGNAVWRDIKVYEDHAFVVSEHTQHGMQVFDLTRLRDVRHGPVTFTADTVYRGGGLSTTHNLDINEDTGFAYLVGTNTCNGGWHMTDISDPTNPTFAGCMAEDGYVHDSQCVEYDGPDERYAGREVCFGSNEDTVTIVDVTDKASPEIISRTTYPTAVYTHQGWLTPDKEYFVFNDEGDENGFGAPPTVSRQTTYVMNVEDLESPGEVMASPNNTTSIDHNLYMKGDGYLYESNYTSGLRIFTEESIPSGDLEEIAWFDVYPENDNATFEGGTWSNYIWFDKGIVGVNTIDRGLFVLKPKLKKNGKGAKGPR